MSLHTNTQLDNTIMVDFSFNGIKVTLGSFTLLSISFNFNINKIPKSAIADSAQLETKREVCYKDYKTTLGGSDIKSIDKIEDDLIVHFFIEKDKDHSAWNLVVPVISEMSTGKMHQYGLGCFALEGLGGGLANTDSMMLHLKNHTKKGFKVWHSPRVVDNFLLSSFGYVDSGVKLTDLLENSTDLGIYRKHSFVFIHDKYEELIAKYKL